MDYEDYDDWEGDWNLNSENRPIPNPSQTLKNIWDQVAIFNLENESKALKSYRPFNPFHFRCVFKAYGKFLEKNYEVLESRFPKEPAISFELAEIKNYQTSKNIQAHFKRLIEAKLILDVRKDQIILNRQLIAFGGDIGEYDWLKLWEGFKETDEIEEEN